MENYEEKYKQALKRAKTILELTDNPEEANGYVFTIFPELCKSEDDRIRKGLIKGLSAMRDIHKHQTFSDDAINIDDAIAWLEKQGEQKPTDKVESKFKVGDWITNGEYTWKVTDIKPLDYILQSPNEDVVNDTISYVDECFRLWTIQDAKDGDVLATENFIFIFKNIDNDNGVHYYCHYEINKHEDDNQFGIALSQSLMGRVNNNVSHYSPATKEQHDLLFQKMKEDGYEWDTEKKKLKKIEQPAWSEEDEKMLNSIIEEIRPFGECPDYPTDEDREYYYNRAKMIDWLESIKDRVQSQPKQEWSEYDKIQLSEAIQMIEANSTWIRSEDAVKKVSNWLKSLKPNHWKPSEEQMQALKKECLAHSNYQLCRLLEELEKL